MGYAVHAACLVTGQLIAQHSTMARVPVAKVRVQDKEAKVVAKQKGRQVRGRVSTAIMASSPTRTSASGAALTTTQGLGPTKAAKASSRKASERASKARAQP